MPTIGWNVIRCSTCPARYPVSSSSSRAAVSAASSPSSISPPGSSTSTWPSHTHGLS